MPSDRNHKTGCPTSDLRTWVFNDTVPIDLPSRMTDDNPILTTPHQENTKGLR
jgi:hypothetical protein